MNFNWDIVPTVVKSFKQSEGSKINLIMLLYLQFIKVFSLVQLRTTSVTLQIQ